MVHFVLLYAVVRAEDVSRSCEFPCRVSESGCFFIREFFCSVSQPRFYLCAIYTSTLKNVFCHEYWAESCCVAASIINAWERVARGRLRRKPSTVKCETSFSFPDSFTRRYYLWERTGYFSLRPVDHYAWKTVCSQMGGYENARGWG